MENKVNVINEPKKVFKDHKVILDNRKKITITSVHKAISANATNVILQLSNNKVYVSGNKLHLSKLDIEQGVVEVEGEITGFKYTNSSTPESFIKRIFK